MHSSDGDSDLPEAEHTCPGCIGLGGVVDVPAAAPLPAEYRPTLDDRVSSTEPSRGRRRLPDGCDEVRRPAHYVRLQPEPAEVIEAWDLGWHAGSMVGYIARAGYKGQDGEPLAEFSAGDAIRDIDKARQMAERWIAMLRGRQ